MLQRAIDVAALLEQEGEAVVRPREAVVELERLPVVANRFVDARRLGERNGHVLQDAGVVGVIAQRQAVGRERRFVITLPLEGERLVEIVESLGVKILRRPE